jgi:hypothetical protein
MTVNKCPKQVPEQIPLTNQLNVWRSFTLEATNSRSTIHKIPGLLWKWNVHYRVNKSQSNLVKHSVIFNGEGEQALVLNIRRDSMMKAERESEVKEG